MLYVRGFTYFVLLCLFSTLAIGQTLAWDEARDSSGAAKQLYNEILPVIENMTPKQKEQFRIDSRKAFNNDNALHPMPRFISAEEDKVLKAGVEQRARALVMFLEDYFSGERRFEKAGIIPRGLVDTIAARNGDHLFQGRMAPKQINFFYGPDIIRDQNGVWRVIEDNPGYVGGIGDLKLAQEYILRQYPQIQEKFKIQYADDFYKSIAKQFNDRAKANGGRAIIYMQPPFSDNEEYRIQEIFTGYGIEVITPKTAHKKLLVKNDGVYLDYFLRGRPVLEKVGFMFLNGEHAWLDSRHPIAHIRNLLETAADTLKDKKLDPFVRNQIQEVMEKIDLKTLLPDIEKLEQLVDKHSSYSWRNKTQIPGLLHAIIDGRLETNYTPGIDFIGDKQFYMFVEDLIRFYLKNEPIIKNIPTRSFANKSGKLDKGFFDEFFNRVTEFVAKKVDGRGGDGVMIGPKAENEEIEDYKKFIAASPNSYISQEFLYLSELDGLIVDLRAITMVMGKQITVGPKWGRGLPKDGNGKVNISLVGREVTIITLNGEKVSSKSVKAAYSCKGLL